MQRRRIRSAVVNSDLNQHVLWRGLGVLDEDIKIAVLIEHTGVEQFILKTAAPSLAALFDQISIGKRRLGILVQILHVRVRRRAVEIEVILLDILAVVAFAVGQPKQALFKNRVLFVPQGQGKAQPLVVIGDSGQTVLAPAIGARTGLVVSEVGPSIAFFTVIFAHGPPLPFAEIRSPFLPWTFIFPVFYEPS